jgi:hypothetical protein
VQDNEINTALAEKNNIGIELKTAVGNATNTMDVVINKAKAQADSELLSAVCQSQRRSVTQRE